MTLETELSKVTGVKAGRGKDRQKFLQEIADALNDPSTVSEDEYNGLSDEARDWWEERASKALSDSKAIPDFVNGAAEEEPPAKKVKVVKAKTPKKAAKPVEEEKPTKTKTAKAPKAPKAKAVKAKPTVETDDNKRFKAFSRFEDMMVEFPHLTLDEAKTMLADENLFSRTGEAIKDSTIRARLSIRNGFFKRLQAAGKLVKGYYK